MESGGKNPILVDSGELLIVLAVIVAVAAIVGAVIFLASRKRR